MIDTTDISAIVEKDTRLEGDERAWIETRNPKRTDVRNGGG
jgi:hypothetical protein